MMSNEIGKDLKVDPVLRVTATVKYLVQIMATESHCKKFNLKLFASQINKCFDNFSLIK